MGQKDVYRQARVIHAYLNVNVVGKHLQPSSAVNTETPWCGEILQQFTCLTIVHWHDTLGVGLVGRVCLTRVE